MPHSHFLPLGTKSIPYNSNGAVRSRPSLPTRVYRFALLNPRNAQYLEQYNRTEYLSILSNKVDRSVGSSSCSSSQCYPLSPGFVDCPCSIYWTCIQNGVNSWACPITPPL
jgi:hypothetical protein